MPDAFVRLAARLQETADVLLEQTRAVAVVNAGKERTRHHGQIGLVAVTAHACRQAGDGLAEVGVEIDLDILTRFAGRDQPVKA